eukprot:2786190-Ditylum_brightwellii.AAC.1
MHRASEKRRQVKEEEEEEEAEEARPPAAAKTTKQKLMGLLFPTSGDKKSQVTSKHVTKWTNL